MSQFPLMKHQSLYQFYVIGDNIPGAYWSQFSVGGSGVVSLISIFHYPKGNPSPFSWVAFSVSRTPCLSLFLPELHEKVFCNLQQMLLMLSPDSFDIQSYISIVRYDYKYLWLSNLEFQLVHTQVRSTDNDGSDFLPLWQG